MDTITIQNLNFTYPHAGCPALRELSLSLPAGSFTLLCGPSGCGKSTLLRLMKKKLSPAGDCSGDILFEGRPLEEMTDRRQAADIGFVMQNPETQIVTDKVWHELSFGLENLGVPAAAVKRRVGETAGFFGITAWYRSDTACLSGGQKQLLNLAAVMAMGPRLLLLDEPISQLDPIAASSFIAMLQKINRELGVTVLLTEHRLEETLPAADQVVFMTEGKIRVAQPPRQTAWRIAREHPRYACGLPAAARIFASAGSTDPTPLTVREGQDVLRRRCPSPAVSCLFEEQGEAAAAPTALELKEVWFRYEKEKPDVLRGANLRVRQGEILALLGDNGAGKSTLLSVLAGTLRPYRGKVLAGGRELRQYKGGSLYRRLLSYLPQNPQTVFVADTLEKELDEVKVCLSLSQTAYEERRDVLCERLGIAGLLDRHPYDLSGGEQQKAALAKILLLEPRLLLLDEPTKGIDPVGKQELTRIFRQLRQDGLTLMLATHDVEFAAETADRCGLLFDGDVVGLDRPEVFFSQNHFYTTAASRISRGIFEGTVTCDQVAALCRRNGGSA
ncbi:MAG: ABC transporter ATP-binding protein [Clostridiales bacterium]|nr:ABC transporter ATP-binding protein [Clostridiales bacterium]